MSVSEEMIGNFTPHCVADKLPEGGKISVEVRTREYLAATELQFQKYLKADLISTVRRQGWAYDLVSYLHTK